MRGSKLRFVCASLLAALCAALTLHGVTALAQPVPAQPPGVGVKVVDPKAKDGKDKKDDRPAGDSDLAIGFPYDRDSRNQLKAARDYLGFKDVPWKTVCPLLQNILNTGSDSFFNIDDKSGDRTITRRISVKTEANRIISAFPKEGLQFYQQAYGQDAADLLAAAARNNYDLPALSEISQRYFHTKAGGEATAILGSIYLERGNYLEAAYAFERLLARPDSDDLLTGRTLFKAAVSMKRSGDPRHVELTKTAWDKLTSVTKNGGLAIGRKNYTAVELRAELDRPVAAVAANVGVGEWAMYLGNPQRNATAEGGTPFLEPVFTPLSMFRTADDEGNSWIKGELGRLYQRDGKARTLPIPAFFPLTTPDMIVYRSYNGVYAFATRDHVVTTRGEPRQVRAGELRWLCKSTVGTHQLMSTGDAGLGRDIDAKENATQWWGQYIRTDGASLLYDNPLLGSLSHDGTNVFFIDDVAIPPPPVPAMDDRFGGRMPGQQVLPRGELADAVKAGRLVAVDMLTGKIAWELGRMGAVYAEKSDAAPLAPPPPRLTTEEADKTTNAFQLCLDAIFLGPPLTLNGRLYVLVEQSGAVRLLCLDPKNLVPVPGRMEKAPTLIWSQNLGRPNNQITSDPVRRYQGAYLAAAEGILVCPTNSGAVVGVDIMSRSLLWAHAYRKVGPNDNPTPRYDPNTGMMIPAKLPVDKWRAASPVISNGRVVVTAYDSNLLECIDLRSGKVLWETARQADDLYVGGVVNDRVIVVGKKEVRAYHLTGEDKDLKPKVAWERVTIPNPTGHGVASKTTYFVPVRPENAGANNTPAAEIWAVNIETGAVTSKTTARKRNEVSDLAQFGLGNLVFQDGIVYAQSPWEVAAYPQLEVKKAEMDRRLKDNPRDPLGLTDRGELNLDDGQLKAAVADFKEAQKNLKPEDTGLERRLREKLHDAFKELLRADFTAGEPYLKEYEALCELPLDTDDPDEKVRRIDESQKRKRMHLYLLARGREGQNRLSEAFDHYLTLANLGEGKSLIDMPDEPSVRMRPDVWARGRIESMIRGAKDAAARKNLECRVQQEWLKVSAGTDLARLREFVSVFGPYFATGAEAQFKLADLLLETNNEGDAREAQGHLAGLRADADDPAVRARATERLARMMVKNGMVEDAVGLYLQLGKEYPDVPVRDGKTGADFLTDLLTDKRLLPYLEPSRYPLPTRVKAEARYSQTGLNNASFEVEPGGDLLPMFRRLRFVIDTTIAGNNTWTLRAFDRSTGAERCRFGDIQMASPDQSRPGMMGGGLGVIPFSRGVAASGHHLVAQVGTWVYCFDLAEKKERWRKNLMGETATTPQLTPITEHPDGDFSAKGDENTAFTLGRSFVLQPGFVCLRTAAGLEVFEPTTRRVMWTRTGLGTRTLVFGDARYILLVELDDNRKPTSTKLVRAVDGVIVEEAGDAGKALAAAGSYRPFGRTVLLSEGGGEQPRVLRLLDLGTNKDVWKKQYPADGLPLKALNPEWCGVVQASGEVEVLAARTGKPVARLQLDAALAAEQVKAGGEALLLADAERFFLALDRDPSVRRSTVSYSMLRTQKVNGPLYCFDRATGKRQWFYEGVFDNQALVMDQFADVPVVMAVAQQTDPASRQPMYKIVVIEKARGIMLYNNQVQFNGGPFQTVAVDLRNGTVELQRQEVRIHISADGDGRAAP